MIQIREGFLSFPYGFLCRLSIFYQVDGKALQFAKWKMMDRCGPPATLIARLKREVSVGIADGWVAWFAKEGDIK